MTGHEPAGRRSPRGSDSVSAGIAEPDDDHGRLLALADELAVALEERAAPVVFRVARSAEELSSLFRLRYLTVTELAWASPAELPNGVERDKFDDLAVQIGGWHASTLVACARLVFPAPGRLLPTEEEFDLRAQPTGAVVDLGRGIVAHPYRDPEHRVLLGLFARCWREIHSRGLSRVCAAAPAWLVDTYRRLGFEVEVIGPAHENWGEVRHPIVIDGLRSVETLMRQVDGPDSEYR